MLRPALKAAPMKPAAGAYSHNQDPERQWLQYFAAAQHGQGVQLSDTCSITYSITSSAKEGTLGAVFERYAYAERLEPGAAKPYTAVANPRFNNLARDGGV